MDVAKIPIGRKPPDDVNVIVEIPQGGEPVKYELDKESGAVFVDRFLHTAMFYPGNYGFVPHTLAEDGDPISAHCRAGFRSARSGCAVPSHRRVADGGRGRA
jgi:inorganic pyrophosphatase